ncbi:type VI secretion system-associated protein TagF [Sphingomonas sp. PL-96]|uniref:type VI secretion system-associated protein TagF n=1 Tax=Sphingomonas sp. PL-96 TaxID=2887201 RepID=UPI001E37FF87|nr:type VI secretion system-associated protein TagF [Sphingomonas sp. PL-96]MCC2975704.1 type VI secretion system-associated protein TagF [Sphingomonas sp. PL-96]
MSALLFGKLPAHGDFVARGLAFDMRDALDGWLSASLLDARDAYGAAFEERFDAAVPWQCEGDGVAGAIAASQDAAGRRFPLLLLCGGRDPAQCEDLLYAAIGEGWTADRLADEAGAAPQGSVARWQGNGRERAGAMPVDLLKEMLA